jgi:hypothetical protein
MGDGGFGNFVLLIDRTPVSDHCGREAVVGCIAFQCPMCVADKAYITASKPNSMNR